MKGERSAESYGHDTLGLSDSSDVFLVLKGDEYYIPDSLSLSPFPRSQGGVLSDELKTEVSGAIQASSCLKDSQLWQTIVLTNFCRKCTDVTCYFFC